MTKWVDKVQGKGARSVTAKKKTNKRLLLACQALRADLLLRADNDIYGCSYGCKVVAVSSSIWDEFNNALDESR